MEARPRILLTGAPGSGKTTLVRSLVENLDPARTVGFTTEEVRRGGERQGFRAALLHGGGEALLAQVGFRGPRVGRYGVDVEAFEALVLPFLEGEVAPGRLHVLDEVGKMECLSSRFVEAVERLVERGVPLLATVPLRGPSFVEDLKRRPGLEVLHLRPQDREHLREELRRRLEPWVRRESRAPA